MKKLMRVKPPPICHLPLKGSTGKVGLSRKMFPSSSAVKSARKARGFAPFGSQLQFQAVGQVGRCGRTVIHCLLHVLKHGRFIVMIIEGSKEVARRFLEVGRVTSGSPPNAPLPGTKKTEKPRSQQLSPPPPQDQGCRRDVRRKHPRRAVEGLKTLPA